MAAELKLPIAAVTMATAALAALALGSHPHHGTLRAQPGHTARFDYKTRYFEQKVDHFGFAEDSTFKQRYLIGDRYWNQDGGPILFYTGNEGDITWFCNNTGFMWDVSKELGAMLVFAEHRYYGESMPFGKKSFSNPKYLNYFTSEQALADFAVLIRSLKQTIPGAQNSPVIAIGGSYGGMLAAWFRMKYPNIVVGALAASAPIWQFEDLTPCGVFYTIVTNDFLKSGKGCVESIRNSWDAINNLSSRGSLDASMIDIGQAVFQHRHGCRVEGSGGEVKLDVLKADPMPMDDVINEQHVYGERGEIKKDFDWNPTLAKTYLNRDYFVGDTSLRFSNMYWLQAEDLTFLSRTFNLCSPLQASDVASFKSWLSETWVSLAMVDYPYKANFLQPLPAWPIEVVCTFLQDPSLSAEALLKNIFQAVNIYYNYTGNAECLNISQTATSNLDDQGWYYQTCTEMVMPSCTDGVNDMFESVPWDFQVFSDNCKKDWGLRPRPDWITTVYGGKNISSHSNIVFSNGGLDPWAGGGVTKSISDTLIAISIPEGAHHLDLRSSNAKDPSSVRKARALEVKYIKKWIEEAKIEPVIR